MAKQLAQVIEVELIEQELKFIVELVEFIELVDLGM